ncbi:MAG TPA: AAA family ATPase [Candidatus Obscuribacterales bacterium]
MTVPVIAFFNNKGGVGKTSLVYHVAWMYTKLGLRIVVADLDPQSNLTAGFVEEDRLEELWANDSRPDTIYGAIHPLLAGIGDIAEAHLEEIDERIALVPGDLWLSGFEDELSEQWTNCLDGKERAFRITSAFWRIVQSAAQRFQGDLVLLDLGPNLGSINRAALVATTFVVVPLSPDLFSLQGLRNLGPTLREWRSAWTKRLGENRHPSLLLPAGEMRPAGYVVLQHSERLDRPVAAYQKWITRIPAIYKEAVLAQPSEDISSPAEDENCLALIKHYRSLIPMAQEARKPIFDLKPADGAIGAHYSAVREAYKHFKKLAEAIAFNCGISLPREESATY